MEQLYIALEPNRNEYILPAAFGSGARRSCILASGVSTLDAMAVMLTDTGPRNRRQADVHITSRSGRWAGKRIVIQGEQGRHGDTTEWHGLATEADAYAVARCKGFEMGSAMVSSIHRVHGMAAGYVRTICNGRTISTPVTIGLRREGPHLVVDEETSPGEHLANVRKQVACRIASIDADTYVIDAWEGARRVIANLDRREYINPEQLAEIPTIAGMLRGHLKRWTNDDSESTQHQEIPTALGLLGRMLLPADANDDPRLGRWRGNRIVITNEESASWPTTVEIKANPAWRDITPELIDHRLNWLEFHRRVRDQRYGDIAPEAA